MLLAGVSEGRSRWIQGTPKSFMEFDSSRGAHPPRARLPPARLTGKRGPWPGIPACRFLARAYGHISLPHGDSRGSASTGLLPTSTSRSGVWMDGQMDGWTNDRLILCEVSAGKPSAGLLGGVEVTCVKPLAQRMLLQTFSPRLLPVPLHLTPSPPDVVLFYGLSTSEDTFVLQPEADGRDRCRAGAPERWVRRVGLAPSPPHTGFPSRDCKPPLH